MNNELMKEIGILQESYQKLINEHRLTKKAMCDLVCPFRDKYKINDVQALMVARNEMTISEMFKFLGKD